MATVQVHKFDSGSTNYIELNYKVTGTRPNLNTLNISFTNLSLSMPAKYTNSSGEKVDNEGTFSYWLGVWPKIVLKNGSKKVYTYDFQIDDITNGTHTFNDGRGTRKVLSNLNKALVVKPYKQDHQWTSYTGDHTTLDISLNLSSLTESQKKGIDTAELYVQCYSFHCCVNKSGSYESWGGCPCADHNEDTSTDLPIEFWTEVNAGSIDIVDNGDNTFTIDATSGSTGINNSIHLNRIFYKIVPSGTKADSISYTYDKDYDFTSNNKTMAKTISSACTVYAFVRTYGTKYGTPANPGGDARNKADSTTDSQVIKYYTFPTPPTKIWINTGKASQYPNNIKTSLPDINDGKDQLTANNDCKPRNKEILMWKWDGATKGGGAAAIDGFRVYIHKIAKGTTGSPATKTPDNTINLSGKTLYEIENEGKSTEALDTYTSTETSKGSNTMYGYYCDIPYVSGEANDAQFGFIPKDLGFNAGDLCYCEVFTYNTWGDGDRRYSKTNATDADYTPIIGSCNIFNGATVWVRVPDPKDSTKLKWAEGTVYVYHDNEWKEAEGVYVRDGGKWKEST